MPTDRQQKFTDDELVKLSHIVALWDHAEIKDKDNYGLAIPYAQVGALLERLHWAENKQQIDQLRKRIALLEGILSSYQSFMRGIMKINDEETLD